MMYEKLNLKIGKVQNITSFCIPVAATVSVSTIKTETGTGLKHLYSQLTFVSYNINSS